MDVGDKLTNQADKILRRGRSDRYTSDQIDKGFRGIIKDRGTLKTQKIFLRVGASIAPALRL